VLQSVNLQRVLKGRLYFADVRYENYAKTKSAAPPKNIRQKLKSSVVFTCEVPKNPQIFRGVIPKTIKPKIAQ
jgi:hypothetical protein